MNAEQKKFTGEAVACGHCGNHTLMAIVASYVEDRSIEPPNAPPIEQGETYEMLRCPACSEISLMVIRWNGFAPEELGASIEKELGQIVYPSSPEIPEGLPSAVQAAYKEALAVRSRSPNAYSVMLGRVLEIVCKDRSAKGDTLYQQIANLGARGELPDRIVDVAHGLRKLRNIGAHADIGSLEAEDVPILESLSRAVLEFVYTTARVLSLAERVAKQDQ